MHPPFYQRPRGMGGGYTPCPYYLSVRVEYPYASCYVHSLGMEVYYPYVKGMGNIVQNMLSEFGGAWTVGVGGAEGYCVKDSDEMTATFDWGGLMSSTIVRCGP